MKTNTPIFFVTIDDPFFLPTKSIHKMITIINEIINFKYVILNDINGANVPDLIDLEGEVITIQDLLKILLEPGQFDWGAFFLFCENPINWDNPHDYYYPNLIRQTDTTVRAVDDQYIYIYTPFQEIVDLIKVNYRIESIKYDVLEKLDFPY